MNVFFDSAYSLEDLEQFRDENGFIDLSKAGIQITDESREQVGNVNRIKNWVNFNGKKVLIKGETVLEEEKNYGIYAELIVEEIAKQLGIETAHYDLIKINDQEGNCVSGVLSVSVLDSLEERLITLRDIIGDEPQEEGDFLDTTSYDFTVKQLRENLLKSGYSEKAVEELITEYNKRLLFTLTVLDADKHTENIAFIASKVDGESVIRLSPNYDSEASLMLDYDLSTINLILESEDAVIQAADEAHPRIGRLRSLEDGGFDSYWIDTFEAICEDEKAYEYYSEILREGVDMDLVLDNVEKRIHTPLPENVRLLAKYAYNSRCEEMKKVIDGDRMPELEEEAFDMKFLSSLINQGTDKAMIRTGEQMEIGKTMEKDLRTEKELDIDSLINSLFDGR